MILPTLIVRHRRENLSKCSLKGLENHSDLRFFTYPKDPAPDLSGYILLSVGAPELSKADMPCGLLLIDATWRLAQRIRQQYPPLVERSLPSYYKTAYPRRQTGCIDSERGLASVEALYLAHLVLEKPLTGLLDHYYWKEEFFRRNPFVLANSG
jgi:pre-rRNA-processing protein TSR3